MFGFFVWVEVGLLEDGKIPSAWHGGVEECDPFFSHT